MKKILCLLLASSLAMIILAGCSNSKSEDSTNNKNSEENTTVSIKNEYCDITVEANPKKVAVFDMAVLDSIDKLGIDVELAVPTSSVPSSLSKYESVTSAGDIKEPNIEKLFEFEPDLIIISGRQADFQEQLEKIAPVWYINIDTTNLIETFEKEYTFFGELFSKSDEVSEIISTIKTDITTSSENNSSLNDNALILLTNNGKISAYGKGSRFGLIHDVLNIKPADDTLEVSTHGQEVGYEYISKTNPDVIFVVDRTSIVGGNTSASDTLDNDLVKSTNAYKNNKIIYLDSELWYLIGFGINSLPTMINEINSSIN